MFNYVGHPRMSPLGHDDLDVWALVFDAERHALPLRGISDAELPTVRIGGVSVSVDARNCRLPEPASEEWLTPEEYMFFQQHFVDGRSIDDLQSEWDVSRRTLYRMRSEVAAKLIKVLAA